MSIKGRMMHVMLRYRHLFKGKSRGKSGGYNSLIVNNPIPSRKS